MKKDIYKWLIPLLLMFAFCGLFFYGIYYQRELYLQEFNAQIENIGFYKEDIHLLDLYKEGEFCAFLIATGFIGALINAIWLILYSLEDKFYFSKKKD